MTQLLNTRAKNQFIKDHNLAKANFAPRSGVSEELRPSNVESAAEDFKNLLSQLGPLAREHHTDHPDEMVSSDWEDSWPPRGQGDVDGMISGVARGAIGKLTFHDNKLTLTCRDYCLPSKAGVIEIGLQDGLSDAQKHRLTEVIWNNRGNAATQIVEVLREIAWNINGNMNKPDLTGLVVKNLTIKGSSGKLREMSGVALDLTGAKFENVNLINLHLGGAEIDRATFKGCRIRNCRFDGADFSGSTAEDTSFKGCIFHNANLAGFVKSGRETIWFKKNDIQGAKVWGSFIEEGLREALDRGSRRRVLNQFGGTVFDESTRFSKGESDNTEHELRKALNELNVITRGRSRPVLSPDDFAREVKLSGLITSEYELNEHGTVLLVSIPGKDGQIIGQVHFCIDRPDGMVEVLYATSENLRKVFYNEVEEERKRGLKPFEAMARLRSVSSYKGTEKFLDPDEETAKEGSSPIPNPGEARRDIKWDVITNSRQHEKLEQLHKKLWEAFTRAYYDRKKNMKGIREFFPNFYDNLDKDFNDFKDAFYVLPEDQRNALREPLFLRTKNVMENEVLAPWRRCFANALREDLNGIKEALDKLANTCSGGSLPAIDFVEGAMNSCTGVSNKLRDVTLLKISYLEEDEKKRLSKLQKDCNEQQVNLRRLLVDTYVSLVEEDLKNAPDASGSLNPNALTEGQQTVLSAFIDRVNKLPEPWKASVTEKLREKNLEITGSVSSVGLVVSDSTTTPSTPTQS
ncbi:MAG: pentapeptide repeat-containing protein [Deltaproteobacteria bacterium]|nr:pentapeptide repeat-containing protein [Deltaproteobacteria bacterium]